MPGDFGLKSSMSAAPSSGSSAKNLPLSRRASSYFTSLPRAASRFSAVMIPGLSIVGTSPVISTTVDSIPTLQSSPSMMASMRPSMSAMTSLALVGLGLPEMLALGAAIGVSDIVIRSSAALLSGILTATVSRPPVVLSGTSGFFFTTIVSGPGQKFSISATMSALSIGVSLPMSLALAIWTIIGLSEGLPFAA